MKYLYTVPLRDVLADVGVTEDMAYYKVQRRYKNHRVTAVFYVTFKTTLK